MLNREFPFEVDRMLPTSLTQQVFGFGGDTPLDSAGIQRGHTPRFGEDTLLNFWGVTLVAAVFLIDNLCNSAI